MVSQAATDRFNSTVKADLQKLKSSNQAIQKSLASHRLDTNRALAKLNRNVTSILNLLCQTGTVQVPFPVLPPPQSTASASTVNLYAHSSKDVAVTDLVAKPLVGQREMLSSAGPSRPRTRRSVLQEVPSNPPSISSSSFGTGKTKTSLREESDETASVTVSSSTSLEFQKRKTGRASFSGASAEVYLDGDTSKTSRKSVESAVHMKEPTAKDETLSIVTVPRINTRSTRRSLATQATASEVCCIPNCVPFADVKGKSVSFHKFPEGEMGDLWMQWIQDTHAKAEVALPNLNRETSVLCIHHFDQYARGFYLRNGSLPKSAVPVLFPFNAAVTVPEVVIERLPKGTLEAYEIDLAENGLVEPDETSSNQFVDENQKEMDLPVTSVATSSDDPIRAEGQLDKEDHTYAGIFEMPSSEEDVSEGIAPRSEELRQPQKAKRTKKPKAAAFVDAGYVAVTTKRKPKQQLCCVIGCPNAKNETRKRDCEMLAFPMEVNLRHQWISAILPCQKDQCWLPSIYDFICNDHFESEFGTHPETFEFVLMTKPVPTVFPWTRPTAFIASINSQAETVTASSISLLSNNVVVVSERESDHFPTQQASAQESAPPESSAFAYTKPQLRKKPPKRSYAEIFNDDDGADSDFEPEEEIEEGEDESDYEPATGSKGKKKAATSKGAAKKQNGGKRRGSKSSGTSEASLGVLPQLGFDDRSDETQTNGNLIHVKRFHELPGGQIGPSIPPRFKAMPANIKRAEVTKLQSQQLQSALADHVTVRNGSNGFVHDEEPTCVVPGCDAKYEANAGPAFALLQLPEERSLRLQWMAFVERICPVRITAASRICTRHFAAHAFHRNIFPPLPLPSAVPTLKPPRLRSPPQAHSSSSMPTAREFLGFSGSNGSFHNGGNGGFHNGGRNGFGNVPSAARLLGLCGSSGSSEIGGRHRNGNGREEDVILEEIVTTTMLLPSHSPSAGDDGTSNSFVASNQQQERGLVESDQMDAVRGSAAEESNGHQSIRALGGVTDMHMAALGFEDVAEQNGFAYAAGEPVDEDVAAANVEVEPLYPNVMGLESFMSGVSFSAFGGGGGGILPLISSFMSPPSALQASDSFSALPDFSAALESRISLMQSSNDEMD